MKIKLPIIIFILSFVVFSAQSQNVDISRAMTDLASSIKPEAYKGSWKKNKDSWMNAVEGLDISNTTAVASNMTEFISHLKGSAFKKNVKSGLLNQLASPKNAAELTEAFKSLANGIDPSMFVSGFDRGELFKSLGI